MKPYTTSIGMQAESIVADELKKRGYKIIDQNWKTKVCEIDIIAKKKGIIYFVEVKFRSSSSQGDGLEYIGPQKLKRLHFAAQIWVQNKKWIGDYRIIAAAVTANRDNYHVKDLLELD